MSGKFDRIRLTRDLSIDPEYGATKGKVFEVIYVHTLSPRGVFCKGDNGREFKALEGEYETVGDTDE